MLKATNSQSLGPKLRTFYNSQWYEEYLPGSDVYMESKSNNLAGLGVVDVGGPWTLNKWGNEYRLITTTTPGSYLVPSTLFGPGVGGIYPSAEAELWGKGATAVARSWPTAPEFSAATFIGELREGLPSLVGANLWKERTKLYRGAAQEHLNYQFGWLPLVSDIRKFAASVKNTNRILGDLAERSGKNVRQGYRFPRAYSSETAHQNALVNGAHGSAGLVPAYWDAKVERNTWFSGCFTYYIPVDDSVLGRMRRFDSAANKLLGTRITPEVLWNLAPWSWAVDWFGNVGDVITNISHIGRDSAVLKYGYVMEQYDSSVAVYTPRTGGWGPGMKRSFYTFKRRRPANPYSLFASAVTLSAKQLSILGALGISKGTKPRLEG